MNVFSRGKKHQLVIETHTHTHTTHTHTHTTHARTHARTNLNRGDGDCLWIKPVNVDGAVVQLLLGSDWLAWVTANGIAILAGSSNRKTKGGGTRESAA